MAVNDAKLSKILLENPSILVEPVLEHTDDSVSSLFSSLHSFRRTYQFCLLYILAHCKSVNECFSDIFMRVLDRYCAFFFLIIAVCYGDFIHFILSFNSNWYSYLGELATNEKLQVSKSRLYCIKS